MWAGRATLFQSHFATPMPCHGAHARAGLDRKLAPSPYLAEVPFLRFAGPLPRGAGAPDRLAIVPPRGNIRRSCRRRHTESFPGTFLECGLGAPKLHHEQRCDCFHAYLCSAALAKSRMPKPSLCFGGIWALTVRPNRIKFFETEGCAQHLTWIGTQDTFLC